MADSDPPAHDCDGHCWHVEVLRKDVGVGPNAASGTDGSGMQKTIAEHLRDHDRVAAKQEGAAEETTRTMRRLRHVGVLVGVAAALVGYEPLVRALGFLVHR